MEDSLTDEEFNSYRLGKSEIEVAQEALKDVFETLWNQYFPETRWKYDTASVEKLEEKYKEAWRKRIQSRNSPKRESAKKEKLLADLQKDPGWKSCQWDISLLAKVLIDSRLFDLQKVTSALPDHIKGIKAIRDIRAHSTSFGCDDNTFSNTIASLKTHMKGLEYVTRMDSHFTTLENIESLKKPVSKTRQAEIMHDLEKMKLSLAWYQDKEQRLVEKEKLLQEKHDLENYISNLKFHLSAKELEIKSLNERHTKEKDVADMKHQHELSDVENKLKTETSAKETEIKDLKMKHEQEKNTLTTKLRYEINDIKNELDKERLSKDSEIKHITEMHKKETVTLEKKHQTDLADLRDQLDKERSSQKTEMKKVNENLMHEKALADRQCQNLNEVLIELNFTKKGKLEALNEVRQYKFIGQRLNRKLSESYAVLLIVSFLLLCLVLKFPKTPMPESQLRCPTSYGKVSLDETSVERSTVHISVTNRNLTSNVVYTLLKETQLFEDKFQDFEIFDRSCNCTRNDKIQCCLQELSNFYEASVMEKAECMANLSHYRDIYLKERISQDSCYSSTTNIKNEQKHEKGKSKSSEVCDRDLKDSCESENGQHSYAATAWILLPVWNAVCLLLTNVSIAITSYVVPGIHSLLVWTDLCVGYTIFYLFISPPKYLGCAVFAFLKDPFMPVSALYVLKSLLPLTMLLLSSSLLLGDPATDILITRFTASIQFILSFCPLKRSRKQRFTMPCVQPVLNRSSRDKIKKGFINISKGKYKSRSVLVPGKHRGFWVVSQDTVQCNKS